MVREILEGAGGRKFVFAMVAGAGLTTLLTVGKLSGAEFVDAFQWLSVGYLGATSVQASAALISKGKGQ